MIFASKAIRLGRAGLAALLLAVAAAPVGAQQIAPFDEAAKDPALVEFRAALLAKVKARDAAGIVPLLAPDVTLSYAEELKPSDFPRHMRKNPNMWRELQRVLETGGGFAGRKDEFFAPYPYAFFVECPTKDEQACAAPGGAHSAAVVLGRNVPLRARPDPNSPALGKLSHELVGIVDFQRTKTGAWLKVMTRAKLLGYLPADATFQEYGFRAGFKKVGGKWMLADFVVGD
ncbi:MAG: hypothetical protein AB7G15_19840 [Alphaproteobacteria bacterium]